MASYYGVPGARVLDGGLAALILLVVWRPSLRLDRRTYAVIVGYGLVLGAILGWVMLAVLGPVYDAISKMKF